MDTFVLIDRSGSMNGKVEEVVSSLTKYVEGIQKEIKNGYITVATFDTPAGEISFDVVRDKVPYSSFMQVKPSEVEPRGMTPLNDAIGKIMALSDLSSSEKKTIIIITDGDENASKELNGKQAQALIDAAKAKGYEVVFLGAEFKAVVNQAAGYGVAFAKTSAVGKGDWNLTMSAMAMRATDYGVRGVAIDMTDKRS